MYDPVHIGLLEITKIIGEKRIDRRRVKTPPALPIPITAFGTRANNRQTIEAHEGSFVDCHPTWPP